MTTLTVQQIKKQALEVAKNAAIPSFWLTDWLLYVIDKPALFLITDDTYQLTDAECERFNAGVSKMQQGIPLAYLTGSQAFWSLNFKVNEHTLIPRPDTEILIEQVLCWIQAYDEVDTVQSNVQNSKRLLDLGTGSGCIAISLAHELRQAGWQVTAVDISDKALEVAKHNATINNLTDIKFIRSSWYSELSTYTNKQFDIIVSNPPYIDEADEHLIRLQAEPISALSSSNQGLADIKHIVEGAPQYLRLGGLLAIEHGFDQGRAVRQLMSARGFTAVNTIQDFGGNDRITLAQFS